MGFKMKRFMSTILSLVIILSSYTVYATDVSFRWGYDTFEGMKSGDSKDGVTFTTTKKTSSNLYDGQHTFSVAEGSLIKRIEFATTSTNISSNSANTGIV